MRSRLSYCRDEEPNGDIPMPIDNEPANPEYPAKIEPIMRQIHDKINDEPRDETHL